MKSFDPDSVYYSAPQEEEEPTFFFYDLETSGLNPREDRIMQFAGQRTTLDFEPIGDPVNILVKLADDTLPNPGAIQVTKITPQSTQTDGFTEAEFCKYVSDEIFTKNTIEVGYNSVRFDDEHMRYTFWRNFYDPYEWQWKDGRSKWDLLDVVRLVRALRPEGITWPVSKIEKQGKDNGPKTTEIIATNRLELLTKENGIEHKHAHDALSDVEALISVTKLIRDKQPQMYDYLLKMRDKKEIKKLVNLDFKKPFVYASGKYSSKYNKTTVAFPFAPGRNGNVLVFDLRYNLEELFEQEKNFVSEERKDRFGKKYNTRWSWSPYVKELAFNHCPAVAPLGVLEAASTEDSTDETAPFKAGSTGWDKLQLTKEQIDKNLEILLAHPEFAEKMRAMYENMPEFPKAIDAEAALYDSFMPDADKQKCRSIRVMKANDLADYHPDFQDGRLPEILLHYKGRNFPSSLSEDEQIEWEKYRTARLTRQEKTFIAEIEKQQKLIMEGKTLSNGNPVDESVLEDLMLWYQSLASSDF